LKLLIKLQSRDIFSGLRLVGGTALALQINHRISNDLDLFGTLTADKILIRQVLNKLGNLKIIESTENINVFSLNDIKIDIVNYPYAWLADARREDDLVLADIKDIAAMKLAAITGRGTKRDFVDLYFLLKKYSLNEILNFYEQKYPDGSILMVLRSLVYFDDAEKDVFPNLFTNINWEVIKSSIAENVKNYAG